MTDQTTKPIRIAILIGTPLTEQNFERFGIPYLSPYFEVMVFDCLNWVGRNADKIKCKKVYWEYYTTIKTELDLEIAIKEYKPSYAIDAIGDAVSLGIYTNKAQKILAKSNVKFVVPRSGNLPAPSVVNRLRRFLGNKSLVRQEPWEILSDSLNCESKKMQSHKIYGAYINKFLNKLKQLIVIRKNVFTADIRLLAGNKALDFSTNKASQIIWIGSNDFHQFNKAKLDLKADNKIYKKEAFILFIDDALPFASDWSLLNIKPPVTAAKYYPMLQSFFERIESHYGLPVVIAGHQNSKSDESYSSNLGGRTVRFGETASLVLQSTLVLIHGSTATSFAVLAQKPTLFLTTRELDRAAYGMHVQTMADSLGSPFIFIDEPSSYDLRAFSLVFNVKKYRQYETNYLRSELSNETAPWQAFISYVHKRQVESISYN